MKCREIWAGSEETYLLKSYLLYIEDSKRGCI